MQAQLLVKNKTGRGKRGFSNTISRQFRISGRHKKFLRTEVCSCCAAVKTSTQEMAGEMGGRISAQAAQQEKEANQGIFKSTMRQVDRQEQCDTSTGKQDGTLCSRGDRGRFISATTRPEGHFRETTHLRTLPSDPESNPHNLAREWTLEQKQEY